MTQKPISEMSHQEKVEAIAAHLSGYYDSHGIRELFEEISRPKKDEIRESERLRPLSVRERSYLMHQAESDSYRILVAKIFPEPPKWKTFDILPSGIRGTIWTLDPSTFETRCLDYDNDPENEEEPVGFAIKLSGDWHTPPDGLLWMYEAEFITLIESAL